MNLLIKFNDGFEREYGQFAQHWDEFGNLVLLVPTDEGKFKIASQKANDCYYNVIYFDDIQDMKLIGNWLYK